MSDIYNALIGAPPTDQESMQAIANRLRGQTMAGRLGMLTGDKVLSGVGKGMVDQSGENVKQLQDTRQKENQRKVLQKYYDAQEKNWGQTQDFNLFKETQRAKEAAATQAQNQTYQQAQMDQMETSAENQKAEMKFKYDKMMQDRFLELKKLEAEGEDYNKLGFAEAKAAQSLVNRSVAMDDTFTSFKDDYAGSGLPKTGSIANWTAGNVPILASDAMKEKQAWWAAWDRTYNIEERNEMFGATLTKAEKAAWDAANVNPNMEADQIRKAITIILKIKNDNMKRQRQMFLDGEYNPKVVKNLFDPAIQQLGGDDSPDAGGSEYTPGQVVDGYRYKGGDPKQESNWEAVK